MKPRIIKYHLTPCQVVHLSIHFFSLFEGKTLDNIHPPKKHPQKAVLVINTCQPLSGLVWWMLNS